MWPFGKFTYDGLGRLFLQKSGLSQHRFTHSPDWQLLEEEVTPGAGNAYRYEFVWGIRGPNDLICREKYDQASQLQERQYALSDATGNIVGVVPEDSPQLDRLITYDPYGSPTGAGDFQHLFGGYYYDQSTGLYLVRNRVYHPQLGRWLTKDPLGMVDGPNLYEYCAGDPVNFTDPMGQEIFTAAGLLTVGIMSLLGGAGVYDARRGAQRMEDAATLGDMAAFEQGQGQFARPCDTHRVATHRQGKRRPWGHCVATRGLI